MLAKVFGGRAQVALGAFLTISAAILWPVTAFTVFKDEPQGILGLSWAAVVISGYTIVASGLGLCAVERVEAKADE